MSEGSTIVPDYYARCLHRALDQKVKKLRNMLTADEDITSELDKVVCRLMKLALRTSKGCNIPPPTKWMQYKLLDLLTLTERAIERRKRHFVESFAVNAIKYEQKPDKMTALEKIKDDTTVLEIVDKYKHLIENPDDQLKNPSDELDLADIASVSTIEFEKDSEFIERLSLSPIIPEVPTDAILFHPTLHEITKEDTKLERTLAWVEEDVEEVSYPNHDTNFNKNLEVTTRVTKYYKKKFKALKTKNSLDFNCVVCKTSHSKPLKKNKHEERPIYSASKVKLVKKVTRKKPSINSLDHRSSNNFVSVNNKSFKVKPQRKLYKSLYPTASKPIPVSLIELCHPEIAIGSYVESYNYMSTFVTTNVDKNVVSNRQKGEVAAIKQSQLINIVTEDADETIALRRTIGTDADVDLLALEDETLIRSVSNTILCDDNFLNKLNISTENVHSQTIFLFDINEPSTSKGIRHIGMDVQCGPDDNMPVYSMLPVTTSSTKTPKIFTAGIKIEDYTSDTLSNSNDCGTNTQDLGDNCVTIVSRSKIVGVNIRDSDINIIKQIEYESTPTYLTSATSLTEVPKVITTTVNARVSTTGANIIKNIEYSACTFNNDISNNTTSPNYFHKSDVNLLSQTTSTHTKVSGTSLQPRSNKSVLQQFTQNQDSFVDIKNLNLNLYTKLECSINTHDPCERSTASSPLTMLLKSPCKLNMEDSLSELRRTDDNCVQISPKLELLQNDNIQIISVINKKVCGGPDVLLSKYTMQKLCHGGVLVHSYRDKQISEDIMYQGEWQKNIPKVITKRKIFNQITVKKITNSKLKNKSNSKENIKNKNIESKYDGSKPKKSVLTHQKYTGMKQNPMKCATQENNVKKPFRNIVKVPSKTAISTVSSKNPKTAFVIKKPTKITNFTISNSSKSKLLFGNESGTINTDILKKDVKKHFKDIKTNYLPLYLRRTATANSNKYPDRKAIPSESVKLSQRKNLKHVTEPILNEIKNDLLKFQPELKPTYDVFRNEIEKKTSGDEEQLIGNNLESTSKREKNSNSPNSSTCSSPCSIETVKIVSVRPKNTTNRRHSATPYSSNRSNSENTAPNKNKKITKRCKSARDTNKVSENKENIPQTSKQFISKKESANGRGPFKTQKNVYLAHLKSNSPVQSSAEISPKYKTQKSIGNISKVATPPPSKKTSSKINNLSNTNDKEVSEHSQTSNLVLIIEPPIRKLENFSNVNRDNIINTTNRQLVLNWIDNTNTECTSQRTSKIMSAMRELIDETLDFIDDPFENRCSIDSETVILSHENLTRDIDYSISPTSFKTVIETDDSCRDNFRNDIENALNSSFDAIIGNGSVLSLADTQFTVTDFDMLSLKSNTSSQKNSESFNTDTFSPKFSEYFADNELSSSHKDVNSATNSASVREIYERRDQPFQPAQIQTPRALTVQAFSGFSINGDPIPGDQPDPVNFIDSETGSLAMNAPRQTASEELFVSGRSSDSFESCLLDEDSVVPNWLFQIISQQQSLMDDINPQNDLIVPMPEPMYDDNGNILEGPRVGAGAGDGCGIHSDPSQDSSGQGTSLSSSATSSGPQSEAIIIDPSAFAAQFELLRDAVESSVVVVAMNDPEALESAMNSRQGPIESGSQSFSRGEARRSPRVRPLIASDVDADISSIDTDLPDSSDN